MDDDIAAGISAYFVELPDPRRDHTRRHKLVDIVTMAICAVICGADDWEEVAFFAEVREEWFGTFLELPGGIPSHDTFWRVFRALDTKRFEACFRAWTTSLRTLVEGEVVAEVVAIDGKQLRRSHDACHGVHALQLVSAWATRSGLMLGQRRLESKENEIVAVPELLAELEVAGCLVTTDAMSCQVKTAQAVLDRDADYLFALKGNQPALHDETIALFDDLAASDYKAYAYTYSKEVTDGHGRIEIRQAWVISDAQWLRLLPSTERWPQLVALIKIESERRIPASEPDGAEQRSREHRYYISSRKLNAAQAIDATRAHWRIENSLHWVLDMAFREDEARLRKENGAENFAILRRMALSLLKQDTTKKLGIKNKRLLAGWDQKYLLHLLSLLVKED